MKKMLTFIVVTTVSLALLAACAAPAPTPPSASELLNLGERYMLELDYEQAVAQFLAVIEIEPMNARAYIGAAEAYIALGRTDDAVAVLERGLDATGDAGISAMLAALEAEKAAAAAEIVAREARTAAEAVLGALAERIIGMYETQGDAAVAAELKSEAFLAEIAELKDTFGDEPMIHKTTEVYGCGFYNVIGLSVYIGQYADLERSGTGALIHNAGHCVFNGEWANDVPNGVGVERWVHDMSAIERREGSTYATESTTQSTYVNGLEDGATIVRWAMEGGHTHNWMVTSENGYRVIIGYSEWDGSGFFAICDDCGASLGGDYKYGVYGFDN